MPAAQSMQCRRCHAENDAQALFCTSCQWPLPAYMDKLEAENKRTERRRRWITVGVVAGILLVLVIFASSFFHGHPLEDRYAPGSPERAVAYVLSGGQHSEMVTDIEVERGAMTITFRIYNNPDPANRVYGAQATLRDLAESMAKSTLQYDRVVMVGLSDPTDSSDNSSHDEAMELAYRRDTLQSIDWDRVRVSELYDRAVESHIDPDFR